MHNKPVMTTEEKLVGGYCCQSAGCPFWLEMLEKL